MRALQSEQMGGVEDLLTDSYAELMYGPLTYRPALSWILSSYLRERQACLPHAVTLVALFSPFEPQGSAKAMENNGKFDDSVATNVGSGAGTGVGDGDGDGDVAGRDNGVNVALFSPFEPQGSANAMENDGKFCDSVANNAGAGAGTGVDNGDGDCDGDVAGYGNAVDVAVGSGIGDGDAESQTWFLVGAVEISFNALGKPKDMQTPRPPIDAPFLSNMAVNKKFRRFVSYSVLSLLCQIQCFIFGSIRHFRGVWLSMFVCYAQRIQFR